jgi:hypothetical protein
VALRTVHATWAVRGILDKTTVDHFVTELLDVHHSSQHLESTTAFLPRRRIIFVIWLGPNIKVAKTLLLHSPCLSVFYT